MSERNAHEPAVDAMLLVFRASYERCVPFREDRVLGEDLAAEVAPVIEAMARAYGRRAASDDPATAQAPAHARPVHEAFALLTLLSRRAGMLGATPSAALSLIEALREALQAGGVADPDWRELAMVAVEGYSAGREERITRELRQIASQTQVWFALAPRCYGVFLAGRHEPEALAPTLDEIARVLLRGDAASCLLDLSRLVDSSPELGREIAGFVSTVASIGARCVVYGARRELGEELSRLGLPRGTQIERDFDKARELALVHAGHAIRARRRWPKELFARPPRNGQR